MSRSCRWSLVAAASVVAIVALCVAAQAQPMGMVPGGPGAERSVSMMYGQLLQAPTVQKELKLSDEQKTKIREAGEKVRAAMREMFSAAGALSEEERTAKMEELGKKMRAKAEEAEKDIEEALSPDQLLRLREVAIQTMGIHAVVDKLVQEELKLTKEQTSKIKSIGEDMMKKMRDVFTSARDGGDEDRGARMRAMGAKMQEARKDMEKKLGEVLSADQKAAFEKMKGEKLDIPQDELRGRMGRQGPPSPPQGSM